MGDGEHVKRREAAAGYNRIDRFGIVGTQLVFKVLQPLEIVERIGRPAYEAEHQLQPERAWMARYQPFVRERGEAHRDFPASLGGKCAHGFVYQQFTHSKRSAIGTRPLL